MLIGHPDNAVVFDFKPGVDAGAENLSRRGEDQRLNEPRAATGRRRAIDEAMADRAEGETRADVARRLDQRQARPGGTRRTRSGRTKTRTGERRGTEVTAARRVVVKIGSSSLTTATGGIDPEPGAHAGRRPRRDPRRAGSRWCWSPPGRSPPGWPRSGCAPPARPGRAAGRRLVGQGLLVHRYTEELARHGSSSGRCC